MRKRERRQESARFPTATWVLFPEVVTVAGRRGAEVYRELQFAHEDTEVLGGSQAELSISVCVLGPSSAAAATSRAQTWSWPTDGP